MCRSFSAASCDTLEMFLGAYPLGVKYQNLMNVTRKLFVHVSILCLFLSSLKKNINFG